ncbi:hypothetical protein Aperf_G00000070192 [Anoplocephala perfoliata]
MVDKIIDEDLFVGKYDESNPLVLPSKKKVEKKKKAPVPPPRVLSRSKRKELQKQVAKKEKKLSRNELWRELGSLTDHITANASADKLSHVSNLSSKKWRDIELSSSESSANTDDFSSTDEVEVDIIGTTSKPESDNLKPVETEPASEIHNDEHDELPREKAASSYLQLNLSKAKYILVNRDPAIQIARLALPVVAEEARIMEQIKESDVVVICGATGSGKTTQIPQFLYEAGYTRDGYKIGITEPRRVAAISMAERVSEELGLKNREVAYHIRYEKNTTSNTEIKFMTDGILLQEIKKDFQLSSYSAIIIDEAHERSVYTDVLIGLLSLVVRLRRSAYRKDPGGARLPLKLIIMSATLRVKDFVDNQQLFPTLKTDPNEGTVNTLNESDDEDGNSKFRRPGAPPVIKVESRQYPVTCHFSRITPLDYVKAAFRKVITIHKDSPAGGILVFLTGQREVKTLCSWLSKAFPGTDVDGALDKLNSAAIDEVPTRMSGAKRRKFAKAAGEKQRKEELVTTNLRSQINFEGTEDKPLSDDEEAKKEISPISRFNLDNFDIIPADEEIEVGLGSEIKQSSKTSKDKEEMNGESESSSENDEEAVIDEEVLRELQEMKKETPVAPIHALPLYSLLPADQQKLVFESPPEGHRLVVVATNVAETSLTIPDIRYVVDTGKVKSKIYDTGTGSSRFRIVWISQASSEQRAGRAGRTGPGHCYRLYSSRIYSNEMEPFSSPDILNRPIDEVVLLLKSYLGHTPLSRFPLPTPPSTDSVEAAERRLTALGALKEKKSSPEIIRTITPAGRWMARLPLSARFARMLLFANQHGLMPYAVALVAVLSVQDFFLPDITPSSEESQNPSGGENTDLTLGGRKRKRAQLSEADRIAQVRINFLRQFVKSESDLMLGDLAVLLGAFCCFERYWSELIGTLPRNEESGISEQIARVARLNPEASMRQLVQKCGVRWKAYIEVRQLRRQLTQILNANVPDLNLEIDPALPKPTPAQVEQLRQLFLVGSVCHLAAKYDLPFEGLPAKDRRRLKYAYKVAGVQDPVFIETTSPLARENCSFVAFTELHIGSKPYLRNVCAINPEWIPFLAPYSYRVEGVCTMEKSETVASSDPPPIPTAEATTKEAEKKTETTSRSHECLPPPFYDPENDAVLAYAKRVFFIGADLVDKAAAASIGVESGFELPASHTPFPLIGEPASVSLGTQEALIWSIRWFARALLEGRVYPLKSQLSTWFPKQIKTSTPTRMITLSWGLVRSEVRQLISKMLSKKINSRRSLEACLEEDPKFLSNELAAWLPTSCHADFLAKWPPCKAK